MDQIREDWCRHLHLAQVQVLADRKTDHPDFKKTLMPAASLSLSSRRNFVQRFVF
jgi:hypothetical protein